MQTSAETSKKIQKTSAEKKAFWNCCGTDPGSGDGRNFSVEKKSYCGKSPDI